jgi:hypothetical protein
MARSEWQNLNGLWDYAVTGRYDARPAAWAGKILVPFPIESALSGVMKRLEPKDRLWYRRQFTVPAAWKGKHVLLHFGAVDWEAQVFLNGRDLGGHRGGYDAFSFDVTAALRAEGLQELVVSVWDPSDSSWQLRGKQSLRPGGCAYTPCSGIWQTVWIEPVAEEHVERLKIVPDLDAGVVRLTVTGRLGNEPATVEAAVTEGGRAVASSAAAAGEELTPGLLANKVTFYHCVGTWFSTEIVLPMKAARPWSPEDPFLYDLAVTLKDRDGRAVDAVSGYFGMRKIALGKDAKGNPRPMLNGKAVMLAGALDQGYWPDGIYTAPTDEALRFDIEAARKLGLNCVRKHVKVEPDRWYYWADKLGLLVLQDMPTGDEGDAITDLPRSPEAAVQCQAEKQAIIEQLGNHPSIVMWILFNEGWGQHDTLRYARWARQLDPTRLIDEASGFPWHGGGDVLDTHGGTPPKDARCIGITSETGGWGVSTPGHAWCPKAWAGLTYDPNTGGSQSGTEEVLHGKLPPLDDASRQWMTQQVRRLFRGLWANKDESGASGLCYCQLVDVETECNGLLSYDRAVFKVNVAPVAEVAAGRLAGPQAYVVLAPSAVQGTVTWRYTFDRPAAEWFKPVFDDAAWKQGPAGFGTKGTPAAVVGTEWTTADIWARREFTLEAAPPAGVAPLLYLHHDEDVEVYINGVRAFREGGFLSAYDYVEIAPEAAATLRPGKNTLALHCLQISGGQYVDVGLVVPKERGEATPAPVPREK